MKWITPALFAILPALGAFAADAPTIESLLGCEFVVEDDFAGQSFTLLRHGEAVRARWRILGSGVPVVSEKTYAVEVRSEKLCAFKVHVRGPRGVMREAPSELKIDLGRPPGVKVYLEGVSIHFQQLPKPASSAATPGAGLLRDTDPTRAIER